MSGILKILKAWLCSKSFPIKCFPKRNIFLDLYHRVMPFSLFSLYWVHTILVERNNLLANSTGKAAWMVCFSQSCHYFAFHELPTTIAAGTIHALVIQGAKIFSVLNEKASLCQVTATHWKKKKTNNTQIDRKNMQKMLARVYTANKWDDPGGFAPSYQLSPLVTSCLDIAGNGWYSLAARKLVIKTLLGEIYRIITFM